MNHQKYRFCIIMGFLDANENEFHGFWKFGYLALEKFWKSVGNMLEVICTSPDVNKSQTQNFLILTSQLPTLDC